MSTSVYCAKDLEFPKLSVQGLCTRQRIDEPRRVILGKCETEGSGGGQKRQSLAVRTVKGTSQGFEVPMLWPAGQPWLYTPGSAGHSAGQEPED